MQVIGLDLSLSATGVARADGRLATIRPRSEKGYARHWSIAASVLDVVLEDRADVAVIEGYGYARPHTLAALAELGGVVRTTLHRHRVPFVVIAPSALKRFAVGRGNATKEEMLEAASVLTATLDPERQPSSHDEADAYWLRRAGWWRYTRNMVPTGLEDVRWPELEAVA